MYIGPQGIVHGTFNTVLNAGRQHNLIAGTVVFGECSSSLRGSEA